MRAAALAALALVLAGCSPQRASDPRAEGCGDSTAGPLTAPTLRGEASLAPEPPPQSRPTRTPAQAGEGLRGRPLPTGQWWTSALVGPWTEPLVAGPVAADVSPEGVALSYRPPQAHPDHVVQPFSPAVLAALPLERVEVTCYGAFHVVLASPVRGGGALRTTLAQGSPVVWLELEGVADPLLRLIGTVADVRVDGARARAVLDGRPWDLAAGGGSWKRAEGGLRLAGAGSRTVVAVAPAPDGASPAWPDVVAQAARSPVVGSAESLAYVPGEGVARQTLRTVRRGARAGPWALTPLQAAHLSSPRGTRRLGSYETSSGRMVVVEAGAVTAEVPAPGFLPAVPRVPLPERARTAVRSALRADLAAPAAGGGSYFGAKELARLATVAEVAAALGERRARARALARVRADLADWLAYSGPQDARYLAYDRAWGGVVAVPSEFGAHDYNDHHLQYGYLVRAAAVLAAADPGFARRYGTAVDAVVRDFAGAVPGLPGTGLPTARAWNPGVGHSWASGYGLFADGQNQESSSEAVAAWAALARWGLVTGRPALARLGLARHAFEAAAARRYWLGEGDALPKGYRHEVVGVLWGAKLDHATWFSPDPAAVHGIQLLPVGFDTLTRWDPREAKRRFRALLAASGGRPAMWANVLAVEQALYAPASARRLLDGRLPRREPSTGRAIVRYLVETLAVTGPPQPRVRADGPFGLAFGPVAHPTFLTANPTAHPRTVVFRRGDAVLGRVRVPARAPS
ncbi:MAG TPA: glycosyl hydrolase [Gaiellaceae bacterium]|nr:glycosyl hydrolase [Gaiellaceae bacterium]